MSLGRDILNTVKEIFGFAENISDPEQFDIKQFKRLKYQLEAAQNYIFVDEGSGHYRDRSPEEKVKLKLHFRKRAFDSV